MIARPKQPSEPPNAVIAEGRKRGKTPDAIIVRKNGLDSSFKEVRASRFCNSGGPPFPFRALEPQLIPWNNFVPDGRAFLNLCFAKPMVCVRVAFHENNGVTKLTKTTQTTTNKELSAGFTETTKMTKTTGIRGANHGFPKHRLWANGVVRKWGRADLAGF